MRTTHIRFRNQRPRLCLTFDVEEWVLPEEYGLESQHNRSVAFADEGCRALLELLRSYNIHATFFVTGYVAERAAGLVKALSDAGHEIASHTYTHIDLTKCKREELRSVIGKSAEILSGIIGRKIKGFRAPRLYINTEVIEVLMELGFQYDSSVHPAIVPGHYYRWRDSLVPYFFESPSSGARILEIPLSVIPLIRFPISWWWMRNIGSWLTRFGTDVHLRRNRDAVLYFHTWEYAHLPRVKGLPAHLVRGCGDAFSDSLRKFIERYTQSFSFTTLRELSDECYAAT